MKLKQSLADKLYVIAIEKLQKTDGDAAMAANPFIKSIKDKPDLLAELIGETYLRSAAVGYLRRHAADMRGGQTSPDTQARRATTQEQNDEDGGRLSDATQGVSAPSSPQKRDGLGRATDVAQANLARTSREPSKSYRKTMVEAKRKLTVMDTFQITERLSGGGSAGHKMAIGDVPISSLGRIAKRQSKAAWVNAREAELVFILNGKAQKQAHIPRGSKVRDIFDVPAVQLAIDEATKVATYQQRISTAMAPEVDNHAS